MSDLDDREPLGDDEQAYDDEELLQLEPPDPLAFDDEMSHEQHMRLLMKLLHQAISDHVQNGDLQPSLELDRAMLNAKAELDWC